MRVNVYAEEMTQRVEIISKVIEGAAFTGLRFYLELPVTVGGSGSHHRSIEGPEVYPNVNGKPAQVAGPFIHRPGDDDSSAVTFWGKRDLRLLLRRALAMLDEHYEGTIPAEAGEGERCEGSSVGSGTPAPSAKAASPGGTATDGSRGASATAATSLTDRAAIVERISTEVAQREMAPDYGLVGYGIVVSIARDTALRCVAAVREAESRAISQRNADYLRGMKMTKDFLE